MNNPLLDKLKAQIQDQRTADYFSEVLSCFYSGNLRSAVVMLYATVICDLIFKLDDLVNIYGDKGAEKILNELKAQQENNQKSTDWEREVPEKCKDANKILSTADYSNFCSLQQLRHLCAHPVINGSRELYRPNSDIVLGHIRNMLEGILVKPAFQVKELFNIILDDLSSVKDIIVDEKQLKQYVESKFLDKFNSIELEKHIFKTLWKFVFALENDDCKANREINLFVLKLLVNRHKETLLSYFSKDKDYFANNINSKNSTFLVLLIKFFNEYPDFFTALPDAKQLEINAIIDNDSFKSLDGLAIFRSTDFVKHIFEKTMNCYHKQLKYIAEYLENIAGHSKALEYYIELYAASNCYDQADWRFNDFIEPHLDEFDEKQMELLIDATNNNGQIYDRRQAPYANNKIKSRMLALNPNFDFSQYRNF